jgi:hypothetical protein
MPLHMHASVLSSWKSRPAEQSCRLAVRARTARAARFSRVFLIFALTFGSAGCGAFLRSHDVTPLGLSRGDDAMRRMMIAGLADTALHRFGQNKTMPAPSDALLRTLYQGVIAYHAGHQDSSALLLDRAAALLDDRDVMQISREAAALFSSDRALAYQPSRTERLLIPYYGALSYLRMNNLQDAAVEARRLSHALAKLEDEPKGVDRRMRGLLRYFAGLVFEAAGEANDAAVAYRNAAQLLDVEFAPAITSPDSGEVTIIIEDGFVAHRFEQSVTIVLASGEADGLRHDDRKRREETATAVAARALAQAIRPASEYADGPRLPHRHWYVPPPERQERVVETCSASEQAADSTATSCKKKDDDNDFYILRMAWPSLHATRRPTQAARVLVGDSARSEAPLFLNVSDAIAEDFDRERTRILARTIVRAGAKLALVKSAEKSAGKNNEGLGRALGAIANVSGAVLEQADTRSWTLLPGSIGIIRLRLPVGAHPLALEIGGPGAPISGKRLDLGTVDVRASQTVFLIARHW